MNRIEFRDAVDRHGEDLSAWPVSERSEAIQLLASEPAARSILDDARSLRAAIAAQANIRAPAGLADRIVRAALGDVPGAAKRGRRSKASASL